ncbi:MAG TPA: glycosyltransferase [Longimicrobiaceae bacterium]|nr:glycosyltransferase [Longimicrobiaceae bacterium]
MKIVFFVHSVVSDWNHGNAHFLRGLMSSLAHAGHDVTSYESRKSWSATNLFQEHGAAPIVDFARSFPEISVDTYEEDARDLPDVVGTAIADADVVIVHEWNSPRLVGLVGDARRRRDFCLLFHDTHHRPWSDPGAIAQFNLSAYDGVLAFGDVLRDIYLERFGVSRAWTFHEAADTHRFHPIDRPKAQDVIWIGNWGDGERSEELQRFWLDSARHLPELRFVAHGVRYPKEARKALDAAGVEFRGWIPSLDVPEAFAASRVTLHIPRRAYVQALRGIPTIRIFEALACGIPLVSAPWHDSEELFRRGDYRRVETPEAMARALRELATDADAAREQAQRGLETILARHTCDHRASELLEIVHEIGRTGSAASLTPATAST